MTNHAEQIKSSVPILDVIGRYVRLKKSGSGDFKGLCPFHQERTPSFNVNTRTGAFKCFGCGKGGDVISFVQAIEARPFKEVVKTLADEFGVSLDSQASSWNPARRQRDSNLAAEAALFWKMALREHWARVRACERQTKSILEWVWSEDFDEEIPLDADFEAADIVRHESMRMIQLIECASAHDLLSAYMRIRSASVVSWLRRVESWTVLGILVRLGGVPELGNDIELRRIR